MGISSYVCVFNIIHYIPKLFIFDQLLTSVVRSLRIIKRGKVLIDGAFGYVKVKVKVKVFKIYQEFRFLGRR